MLDLLMFTPAPRPIRTDGGLSFTPFDVIRMRGFRIENAFFFLAITTLQV